MVQPAHPRQNCFEVAPPPRAYNGGKSYQHSRAFILVRSFFILAGNEENHRNLDEFKCWQNFAADFGVGCP